MPSASNGDAMKNPKIKINAVCFIIAWTDILGISRKKAIGFLPAIELAISSANKLRDKRLIRVAGSCFSRNLFSLAPIFRLHWPEMVMTLDVLKINWRATLAASAIFLAAIPCSIYAQPTNSHNGVLPGPNDAKITLVTATLLEDFHYSQQQFDRSVSEKFFDEYLSTLDPRRENFLQSDIDSFAHYRTNLDIYTI